MSSSDSEILGNIQKYSFLNERETLLQAPTPPIRELQPKAGPTPPVYWRLLAPWSALDGRQVERIGRRRMLTLARAVGHGRIEVG